MTSVRWVVVGLACALIVACDKAGMSSSAPRHENCELQTQNGTWRPATRIAPVDPQALGLVKAEGGTKHLDFPNASVPLSGTVVSLAGDLRNDTGRTITDVHISIFPKSPTTGNPKPPVIVSMKVGDFSANIGGGATSATIQLKGANQIAPNYTSPLEITLADPTETLHTTEFRVAINASVGTSGAAGIHFDWLGAFEMTGTSGEVALELDTVGNAGQAFRVLNTDTSSALLSISGTFAFTGGDAPSLDQVLGEDGDGEEIELDELNIQGTSFTVSGLSLGSNAAVTLFVKFSAQPPGATTLTLEATHSQ